jgi:plastocyanin
MKRFVLTALVLIGVLIPMTFVPAQRTDSLEDPPDQERVVSVQIIESGGSIAADPDSVSVKRGQRIEWTSSLGDWEVIFYSDQPFGQGSRRIFGKKDQSKGRAVQAIANLGSYQYDIQVTLPDGTVLMEDPEIVVEPGEGEGQ